MSLDRIAKELNREQEQYKLVSLVHHYPGIKGGVKWAVATNLSLEELEKVTEGELNIFKPFILITPEQGKVFDEFEQLDKRLEMEELRHQSAFAFYDIYIVHYFCLMRKLLFLSLEGSNPFCSRFSFFFGRC